MQDINYLNALVVGLFSTLHCIGMCGGIVGALTFSLPLEVRNNKARLLAYTSAYNLGRISSYTLAGAIAGAFGGQLLEVLPAWGHVFLQLLASLLMIGIGLYLAGWFPAFVRVEQLGKPVWKKLEPIGQRLLPVKSPWHAYLFGAIWGWLPCGLVYSALLWSTSLGNATSSALFMLSFGAGTLPAVMTAGVLTGWFMRLIRVKYLKPVVGMGIIILALITAYFALQHYEHHNHMASSTPGSTTSSAASVEHKH